MTCQNKPFELRVRQDNVPYVEVEILGSKGAWQGGVGVLDTGASFTMASVARFQTQFANAPIVANPKEYCSANRNAWTGPGRLVTVRITMSKNGKKYDISRQATVWENQGLLPNQKMDILLGCDFLAFAKLVFLGKHFGNDHAVHFHAVEQDGWNIVKTS